MSRKKGLGLRALVLVYLGILVGLPIVFMVVKALQHGFPAFWHEIAQPQAVQALILSLEVAAICVPINTIVGVAAAILIARHKFFGRRVLDVAFDVPVAVSPVIIGVALVLAYSRIGWFGAPLARAGIQVLFTPLGIVMATLAVSLPYVLRSVVPVLIEVGMDQELAAKTLGAGRFRVFFTITLPAIRWALFYGVALMIARTLGEFGAVLVVSGNISGKTQTLPIYIYDSWDQRFDVFGSYAGALVLALMSILVISLLGLLQEERGNFVSISLRHLSKHYGKLHAVEDVSAEIPHGSLTAILGPSGSGKSTLLKLIVGLEDPDEGSVIVDGEDMTKVDTRHRDVGFCFQSYAPFRHMSVAKNVGFGLKVRKKPAAEVDRRVRELLALVKLEGKENNYPSQLSGGERQRMALARALAIEPRVLLLDEPFGALDAVVRLELRQWLKELHHQLNVTTVLVTHDQQEAMEVADQLIVMRSGKIVQSGNPVSLYESPATNFVHEFLGPSTNFGGVITRPHDLELVAVHNAEVKGRITKIVSLGFESQVTVALDDGTTTWVQLSRNELSKMGLRVALLVGVRRRDEE